MKCTQKSQLTSFPKVRVLKKWFRHFNDHREFRNDGTLHLFSLMALYSYANFRSNTKTVNGWRFMESPGQWICKLGSLPRILRVHSKAQAHELMLWFKEQGFIDFDYLSGKQEIIRFEILDFVGVTTPKTLTSSAPSNFRNEVGEYVYSFLQDTTGEDVYDAVQSAADAARAEGADYVVVMAHLGDKENGHPWNYADVISHTAGIDVMLDGHSHDTDQVKVKNAEGKEVPRSACGTKLECIGWCRIAADGEVSTGLYSWNNEVAAQDLPDLNNDMSRAIIEATDKLNEKLDEVVATTAVELIVRDPNILDNNGKPVRMIRRTETNLGDLCADAYRDQSGADIAFVNGGGIRTNIKAGDITLGNILSVFPTGDSMCVIEVTGQQILDALEWGAHALPDENGGFLQVSGLGYEIHTYIESPCVSNEFGQFQGIEGARRVQNVRVGGEPIDPDKTYTLASHDFLFLKKGDGYTMFDGAPLLQDCVKLDNQLLIDYIVDTLGGVIGVEYADPYGQGRITFVETPAADPLV